MKNFNHLFREKRLAGIAVILLTVSMLLWAGCDTVQSPDALQEAPELVLSRANPQVQSALHAQNSVTEEMLSKNGVVGTATGMTDDGRPSVLILLESEDALRGAGLPRSIQGVPVTTLVTGEIKAIKGGPPGGGGKFDPTEKHRPAPNGVSIGHPDITAGTLGCLVEKGNTTYILSNNHVMANQNDASIGDPIYQPGPHDGGGPGDEIATLSDFEPIVFSTSANNVIDAAIAAVDPADVTGETEGGYGAPQSTTTPASINMRVQKYGRTTEETSGRILAINTTVNVGYDGGTAQFVNQIVIGGGGFSSGGDSGSCIVVQKGSEARKPVGLLFAGSSSVTIANPIDPVLGAFGVTIVGE